MPAAQMMGSGPGAAFLGLGQIDQCGTGVATETPMALRAVTFLSNIMVRPTTTVLAVAVDDGVLPVCSKPMIGTLGGTVSDFYDYNYNLVLFNKHTNTTIKCFVALCYLLKLQVRTAVQCRINHDYTTACVLCKLSKNPGQFIYKASDADGRPQSTEHVKVYKSLLRSPFPWTGRSFCCPVQF